MPATDKAASEAELARINQAIQPWLWDACNRALGADISSPQTSSWRVDACETGCAR